MKPSRQDIYQMVAALMAVMHSTSRARRKGDASRLAALYVIAALPDNTPKAISEELGLHPSSVTRQIQALEQEGHVKVIADPADGRSCRVKLTTAGRAEMTRLEEFALRRFASFVADWDPQDIRTFTRLLIKFEQSKAAASTTTKPPGKRWRPQEK
jgi:DNA-binding MarR family transcriptional regulator